MSEEMMKKEPLKWALAQNMLLGICMKAMLTKLDPEVSREVARAMSAVPDDDFLKLVAMDTLQRVLPNAHREELENAVEYATNVKVVWP